MAGAQWELTEVEQRLVEQVVGGERLDLTGEAQSPFGEADMRSWGAERTVRAGVLRDILLGRLAPDADPHGIRLRGARIEGRLDLQDVTAAIPLVLVDCFLEHGINATDAQLPSLSLTGSRLHHPSEAPLSANLLTVRGAVGLGEVMVSAQAGEWGAVRLAGARIGGTLDCSGAVLRNDTGPALDAESLQIEQSVFLNAGFQAVGAGEWGAVRLHSARIGGTLDCSGAVLRNDTGPALNAVSLQVDQLVFLRNGFQAFGAEAGQVTLDLRQARVGGVFTLDMGRCEHRQDPGWRLAVDGLTYQGLPAISGGQGWLELLRTATPRYAAQPYQQLAAAYRATGHDAAARTVLIQQRRDQLTRDTGITRAERLWIRLTGITLGHGYQPWRALLLLLAVVLTSITLAIAVGGDRGGLASTTTPPTTPAPAAAARPPAAAPCSTVEQVGVGLDLGLPLVKTTARDRCQLTNTTAGEILTVASWILQALAWAFATLFIAGFTNAVRKT